MTSGWQSGSAPNRIGILTAGGPAPGLNGVINAVTLAARAQGWSVVGLTQGYKHLMAGPEAAAKGSRELREADVSGIETTGGSILGMSRANPGRKPEDLARAAESVRALGLTALVTVGGDDTASAAAKLAQAVPGLRVAHVPKTIDNDLPLPGFAPTFGFETAKDLGARLCRNLRVDAKTSGRWYVVTAMGRSAGHLAVGMAVGSGADLCVIPEEFDGPVTLAAVGDLVEAAIVRRRREGQEWGLVVLAEGLLDRMDPSDLKRAAGNLELDEHGNPRMSEIDLGRVVRDVVAPNLKRQGVDASLVSKLLGYELRCADPIAFDVQYTRTLGHGAVQVLQGAHPPSLVTLQEGRIVPIPLEKLRDPATGKVQVRRVDRAGALWQACLALQARVPAVATVRAS